MKIENISKYKVRLIANKNKVEEFFKIENSKPILCKLDNHSKISETVGHIFAVYGYRPPYPFTVFDRVYRISPNKDLIYDLKKKKLIVDKKDELKKIDNNWDINKYYKTFIKSCYTKNNTIVIFMSSGWDSSGILACIKKFYNEKKIIPLILELRYGLAEPVNKIEIIKAKKICDYYGLSLRKVVVDYTKKSSLEGIYNSSKKMLFNITASNHYALWKEVEKISRNKKITVFCGEFSDGAHNFGFSQNVGAIYPVKGFRQYGDKVRSYFISPEFIKRISEDKNIYNDTLVKLFMPGKIINGNNPINIANTMINNMFINDFRGPYIEKINYNKNVYDIAFDSIKKTIIDNFLPKKIEEFYSSIIRLYQYFHWDASTVKSLYLHKLNNVDLVLPFANKNLLSLLETMPTNFGRGLEVEPSKFPLKSFCKYMVDYPLHLQEGNHSYIYDIDQSIDLNCILFNKSLVGNLIRKKWKEDRYKIRKNFLTKEIFDKCKKAVESKKINNGIHARIIKASAMLDIFLEDKAFND